MRHQAISTKRIRGPTCLSCERIEHRALNLTTSSPAFRIPTAHVIFVPSKSMEDYCVCILCKMMVTYEAQEFHLSGKRHARNMKRTRGPRACVCSTPAPIQKPQRHVPVWKSRSKGLRIVNERKNRRPRRGPRHKRRRCRQRSYTTYLMKLGRAGLFPKYFRDNEYYVHAPPKPSGPKARHILAGRLSPLERFYAPPEKPALLFDGMQLSQDLLVLFGSPEIYALALSPSFTLPGPTKRTRREWRLEAVDASVPNIAEKKHTNKRVQKAGAQGSKPLKPNSEAMDCDVCNKNMPPSAMKDHLQGKFHACKAKASGPQAPVWGSAMVRRGVRSLRPHGGAQRILL
ncbi:hypothetical protein BD779DRAFT_1517833 [Infundibulicybe gibba]|nr:hypothetical protein BD779DRAFT_1517833 [Infundibulicybe gibba]